MIVLDIIMCIRLYPNMKLWKKKFIYNVEAETQSGEYSFNAVDEFCKNYEIIYKTVAPHTRESSGKAER